MIRGFVHGQTLRLSQGRVVADTLDYLVARFLFEGEDWTGMEKWMHLMQGDEHYAIKLTDDETRREDHLNLSAGQWLVWLHGNELAGGEVVERITTNVCTLIVEETGGMDGEVMPPVAPDVVEQLAARISALEQGGVSGDGSSVTLPMVQAAVEGALAAAKESGDFDGADGKDGEDGYTPVKGVDYFDGKDGYTPIKGVDYFDGRDGADGKDYVLTDGDKAEIAAMVLADMPQAVTYTGEVEVI